MNIYLSKLYQLQLEYLGQPFYYEDKKVCLELRIPYPYSFVSLKSLAKKYGFSYGYIRNVSCREKWKSKKMIKLVKQMIKEVEQEVLKEKYLEELRAKFSN